MDSPNADVEGAALPNAEPPLGFGWPNADAACAGAPNADGADDWDADSAPNAEGWPKADWTGAGVPNAEPPPGAEVCPKAG